MEKLLESFTINRNEFLEKRNLYNSKTIELYSDIKQTKTKNFEIDLKNLINGFVSIVKESEAANSLTSCNFNIFKMFRLNENKHSYLLAHLLNPYSDHGQKHLFLNTFLDLLGIKRYSDKENWIVTAEKGRIDLLLKRNKPHSVVIIENKSNYAADQENQLYRYWYQEIYNSIIRKDLNINSDYILNPPEEFYQIIYLSPNHLKVHSINSISKPLNWASNLPDIIPIRTKQIVFDEFIVDWLKLSLTKIPNQNTRIKEHIQQYIEYWTN